MACGSAESDWVAAPEYLQLQGCIQVRSFSFPPAVTYIWDPLSSTLHFLSGGRTSFRDVSFGRYGLCMRLGVGHLPWNCWVPEVSSLTTRILCLFKAISLGLWDTDKPYCGAAEIIEIVCTVRTQHQCLSLSWLLFKSWTNTFLLVWCLSFPKSCNCTYHYSYVSVCHV